MGPPLRIEQDIAGLQIAVEDTPLMGEVDRPRDRLDEPGDGAGIPLEPRPALGETPPFHEPHWRYDMHERMSYYRGFHFWLDAF